MKKLDDKGAALLLVVFAMLIVSFLGFALLEVSTVEFAMANNQVDGIKAYYIAEAGMNKAIASFLYSRDLLQQLPEKLKNPGDTMTLDIGESFAGGNFADVRVTMISKGTDSMLIELLSTGTHNRGKKEIVVEGVLTYGYNQDGQFMASDTAIICVTKFTTQSFNYIDGNVFSFGGIDCGYDAEIRGDTFGYGTVSVDDAIVTGNLYGTGDVTVKYNTTQNVPYNITGDITGRGTITVKGKNKIGGNVFGSGKVTLEHDSQVAGSVKSLSDLTMDGANYVGNDVFSFDNISIGYSSDIKGPIFSLKDINISGAAKVRGNIQGGGKVTVGGNSSVINGDIYGVNDLLVNGSTQVTGNIQGGGKVTVGGSSSVINGDIYGVNDLLVNGSTQVTGNIQGGGKVTVGGNSSVIKGNIYGVNDLLVNGSTEVKGNIQGGRKVTVGGNSSVIDGNILGVQDVTVNGSTLAKGNVQAGQKAITKGECTINKDVFAGNGTEIAYGTKIMGEIVNEGDAILNGGNIVAGNFYNSGNMNLKYNVQFDNDVICNGRLTDEGGSRYKKNVYGNTVDFSGWGTNVFGRVYYVDQFINKTGNTISSSTNFDFPIMPNLPPFPSLPSIPSLPELPNVPEPPEIKTFPGIPDVKVEDYQGQPGTKNITSADLTSGRLNLATLTPGVYYVDDSIANLAVYGKYAGTISLVTKGRITVDGNILRTDPEEDALMVLSFYAGSPDEIAIHVNYQRTVEALLFAPRGKINTESETLLRGGAMGDTVSIGHKGKIYHIASILNKFGIGNTGVLSFEVKSWRQTSGML